MSQESCAGGCTHISWLPRAMHWLLSWGQLKSVSTNTIALARSAHCQVISSSQFYQIIRIRSPWVCQPLPAACWPSQSVSVKYISQEKYFNYSYVSKVSNLELLTRLYITFLQGLSIARQGWQISLLLDDVALHDWFFDIEEEQVRDNGCWLLSSSGVMLNVCNVTINNS